MATHLEYAVHLVILVVIAMALEPQATQALALRQRWNITWRLVPRVCSLCVSVCVHGAITTQIEAHGEVPFAHAPGG